MYMYLTSVLKVPGLEMFVFVLLYLAATDVQLHVQLLLLLWQLHQLIFMVICRFYTKQSWFLHGRAENGPTEPPVIGQEVRSFHMLQKIEDMYCVPIKL